jgi:quercetin dioxygenase-like cupin family protein
MSKKIALASLAVLSVACLAFAADMAHPGVFTPKDMTWAPGPPFLPPGCQLAVLEGDPSQSGPFAVRLSMPDGYKIPAHSHPTTEHVTVISGEFHVGMGDKLDETKGTTLPAGSFGYLPAQMNHFAWAKGATVVQVHGEGPFAIRYVDPADDPRTAKQ